jgi:hypothetical protein
MNVFLIILVYKLESHATRVYGLLTDSPADDADLHETTGIFKVVSPTVFIDVNDQWTATVTL